MTDMAIAFNCPHCKTKLKVKDDFAGKSVSCKECKRPVVVPAPFAKPGISHHEAEELALAALSESPTNGATAPGQDAPVAEGSFQAECPNCMETVEFPVKMAGKQAPCSACRRIV